jgi:membrane protease YdiL (CAAX protease family)
MPARLFWNDRERRVRALWRVVLHVVALGLIWAVAGQLLVSVVPATLLASSSAWSWPINAATIALVVAAATGLVGHLLDRRRFAEFGLHVDRRRWWADFGAGVAIGAILMAAIFLVELGAGWLTIEDHFVGAAPGQSFGVALLAPLVLFIAVGFYEELVFRGYQLRNLAEGLEGPRVSPRLALVLATLLSSVAFGLVHARNPGASVTSTIAVSAAGCMLGLGLIWTGELGLSVGLHLSWNFCQGNVWGFAVSGNDVGPRVFAVAQVGDPVITGGAFGPEAGVVGIVAMLVGVGLIFAWVRITRGRVEVVPALARWRPELGEARL